MNTKDYEEPKEEKDSSLDEDHDLLFGGRNSSRKESKKDRKKQDSQRVDKRQFKRPRW